MTALYNIKRKLLRIPFWLFIGSMLLVHICLGEFFSKIIRVHNPHSIYDRYLALYILFVLVIAPLLETFVLQYLVIKIIQRLKLGNEIAVITSAILFGLAHYNSLGYIAYATIAGFLYAIGFIILQQRGNKAYGWICLSHMLYNLYAQLTAFIPYWLDPHKKPLNWDWYILGF